MSATASFSSRGRTVIVKTEADSKRQTLLVMIMGHSRFIMPKANHKAKPKTVIPYIGAEMPPVFCVLMIFQA